jgi:hypothetical protein
VAVSREQIEILQRPLPRREREQIVEDINLFTILRGSLPSRELRALRNELVHLVVIDEAHHQRTGEIHPATGEEVPSPEEQTYLGFRSLLSLFQQRHALLDDSLTAPQVAKLLRASRQTPLNRAKANTLLGVQVNGVWRFPSWQFDPEGDDGVVHGLPQVLDALEPQDSFSKLVWLHHPSRTLRSEPIEVLRAGEVDRVVSAARAVAELP